MTSSPWSMVILGIIAKAARCCFAFDFAIYRWLYICSKTCGRGSSSRSSVAATEATAKTDQYRSTCAQRQTFCNSGYSDVVSLTWWRYYWRIEDFLASFSERSK